ncbi:hypothetical protein [Nocardia terpenica]|nr:hypothetical protein [Nocardia terpenica]
MLEEQADTDDGPARMDHESAFEAGLELIVDGLAQRISDIRNA